MKTNAYGVILPIGNIMKITNTKELGQVIRHRRKELGITQKDLAFAAGTGLRFIVDVEAGKATCMTGKVLQVLNALGLSVGIN